MQTDESVRGRGVRSAAEQKAVTFLLGALPETEQESLERLVLADKEAYEQVSIVEDELIDDYLQGELSGTERDRFESWYLASPEHRDRLDFARALKGHLAVREAASGGQPGGHRHFAQRAPAALWLSAAAMLALLAAGLFLGVNYVRSQRDLDRVSRETAEAVRHEKALRREVADLKAQNDQLRRRIEDERSSSLPARSGSESALSSFTLVAGLVRDVSGSQTLTVPAQAGRVRLTLLTRKGPTGSLQAAIRTVEGRAVWKASGPLPVRTQDSSAAVEVIVPAGRLPDGDYILTLTRAGKGGESEDVDDYFFRVKKKK